MAFSLKEPEDQNSTYPGVGGEAKIQHFIKITQFGTFLFPDYAMCLDFCKYNSVK
jgi:hypothetical protein